jgi:3-hydroxyisobutyrate dehydrogenase-like beta-hydroxyacid dehydrogenase
MRVGLIGLGNMGAGMAQNLVNAGHELRVFNRTRQRAEEFAKGVPLGKVTVADTPAGVAEGAEVVVTMVSDDAALREVAHGANGLFDALAPETVHVSMSTISVALSRAAAAHHARNGKRYIAAPVFGRPEAATAAKLYIVAAGAKENVEKCRPLFDAMGQKTFVVGEEAHAANVVKIIGNFLITTAIESLAESFALAEKSGVSPRALLDVLTNTLFNAPIYKTYGGIIAENKYEPVGFAMPLGFKDNRLIISHAEETSVPMPMASLVHDRFLAAMATGLKDADWSAIALIAMREAGLDRVIS